MQEVLAIVHEHGLRYQNVSMELDAQDWADIINNIPSPKTWKERNLDHE